MDNDVASILGELRRDHKNMTRLLSVLERESNRIQTEQDADIELMQDVMHYMTVYPDAVHHLKEDRIYAELKKHDRSCRQDSQESQWTIRPSHSRACACAMTSI